MNFLYFLLAPQLMGQEFMLFGGRQVVGWKFILTISTRITGDLAIIHFFNVFFFIIIFL